jgi:predicted nuclease of restriction endonuclease-like (RecB) superfamily
VRVSAFIDWAGSSGAFPLWSRVPQTVALFESFMTELVNIPEGYGELLEEIARRIARSQTRAALAVSRELVLLYWSIGAEILLRQRAEGWGAKVIERLGRDLQARFPGVEGFSPRNLKYMRSLAEAWPDPEIVPQRVALVPWGHLRLLLDKVKDREAREWYLGATVREGWNRDTLGHMIEGKLYARAGKSLTNFVQTLPPEQSEMAVQVLRDPYNFDFLTLTHPLEERKLERGLLIHMRDLLLELGRGFAFIGSQVPLAVGEETFYLDLLFYHVRLHCYFVIELKVGRFKPEYAGKLNFYLSAVDGLMRTERDGATIGLLLCESHEGSVVEYSFKDIAKPIGVSTYRVTHELPKLVRDELPTVEDLQGVVAKLKLELTFLQSELDDE